MIDDDELLQAVTVSGRTVWLASEDRGVIRFRAGKFESFDRAAGLPGIGTAPRRQPDPEVSAQPSVI